MICFARGCVIGAGFLALASAGPVVAQENLDLGKTPAQLYTADCAICHKSPQGMTKNAGVFGLSSFLREHYTASRQSAAAIAAYVESVDKGPPPAAAKRPASKRNAKGGDKRDDKRKDKDKPGEAKADDAKTSGPKTSGPKTSGPKTSDSKPSEAKPGEAKPEQAKAGQPNAGETKSGEPKSSEPKSGEPKLKSGNDEKSEKKPD
ncbi:MAG: hypothetical protein ACRECA_00590 [Pseudolabrys sp.]